MVPAEHSYSDVHEGGKRKGRGVTIKQFSYFFLGINKKVKQWPVH